MRLIVLYALPPMPATERRIRTLTRFSLPLWGYVAAVMTLVHIFGQDTVWGIVASVLLAAAPLAGVWFWLYRRSPPQRFEGIRRVAVCGGGWSGIYATKWLDEMGLDVTCYEARDCLGGVWNYRTDRPGGVFEATRVTSSKHFLHASDYPFPESVGDFPHHREVFDYLQGYIDHFGVRDRFRLDTRVVDIARTDNGYSVEIETSSGERSAERFDAVVVSSGPHQSPNIDPSTDPIYSGFTGRIIHSAEYKNNNIITKGEVVLVVGAGESSADIVSECVGKGATLIWATRSGQWFADRNMGPFPADHITTQGTRVFVGLFANFEYIIRRFITGAFVNLAWGFGGHGIREWFPDTPYLHQFLNKSRDALLQVYAGNAMAKRAPVRIDGNDVYFGGEEKPVAVDTIILCSGYTVFWPFLRERPQGAYKLVFDAVNPRLAFVGFARPIVGSIPSLAELQARWVASVWSRSATLPAPDRLRTEQQLDRSNHDRLILDHTPLRSLVDQELYATELASQINAQVHWFKLLLLWPRAFFILLASPWVAFKYRLNDRDPAKRERALSDMIRELPPYRAPAYLLAVGIVTTVTTFSTGTLLLFLFTPLPVALAVFALVCLIGTWCSGLPNIPGEAASVRRTSSETFFRSN